MKNSQIIKTIHTEDRACESCGGSDLEVLWHYKHDAKTRGQIFQFDVRNVICRDCGFVFVAPVFVQPDLADYYSSSYSAFVGQQPDYDTAKRIDFIANVSRGRDLLVEIGSNQQSRFHDDLRRLFKRVVTVELNDSVDCDGRSVTDLSITDADVVAHYFVLEHVPRVKEFLTDCHCLLKPGGVMICEVPDISIYPTDPAGLELWEHTNHFSAAVLDQLAGICGFDPIASSHDLCSRSFGFVSAYAKAPVGHGGEQRKSCYEDNKKFFLAGVERMNALRRMTAENWKHVKQYEAQGKTAVFWAANEMMSQFLQGANLPENVRIVDSNPAKAGYFNNHAVHLPEAEASFIRASEAVFIFTAQHVEAILKMLHTDFGKTYSPNSVHIVDYELD